MLYICLYYIWNVFVIFLKLIRPHVLCNESCNCFCNPLCCLGELKDSGPFTNIVSLTLSWPIFATEIDRFLWALVVCFSVSIGTSRNSDNPMFSSKMGWHVAGIVGLVARIIHTYFTYGFIIVRSSCSINVDNFKSKVFTYICMWNQ
jgi:hypothetical protein